MTQRKGFFGRSTIPALTREDIRKATEKAADTLELSIEELEERIAPGRIFR
jgi:hypothetical protein